MAGLEGTRLGAYELLERLGEGGMAEVYRARQSTAFGREVAIKVILPEFSQETTFRARFLREAEAVSRLSHPHILPLIEAGEERGTLYLVMPLVREGTLLDVIRRRNGPLPLDEVLPLFSQLCSAVHYAHSQGIIHRDLKPQNVLLQQGTHVLLGDFGIARSRAQQEQITKTGTLVGSAAYMAPEQVLGEADARSDIYSLGVVLYEMVTGRLPYEGATSFELIVKHSSAPVPDPRSINPALSPELADIIQTALAKNPQERFQSAVALRQAVQQSSGGAPASSRAALPSSAPVQPVAAHNSAPRAAPTEATSARPAPASTGEIDAYRTRPALDSQSASQPAQLAGAAPTFATQPGLPDTLQEAGRNTPALSARPASLPGTEIPGAEMLRVSGSGPAVPAPGFAPAPAPGGAVAPPTPPRPKKRPWLLASLILAAVLVLAGAGVLLARWFFATGSQPTLATTATATPGGFLTYTNPDQTFKISYPPNWQQKPASAGTGAEFDGPGNASLTVTNHGGLQTDAPSSADLFCTLSTGAPGTQKTVTIGGQRWVQEACGTTFDGFQTVVEVVAYKGNFYMIVYQARPDDFASYQTKYFAPMEQSFTFLQ